MTKAAFEKIAEGLREAICHAHADTAWMDVGEDIARRHQENVLAMINELGQTPEQALRGNIVWLAAEIMRLRTNPPETE